VRSTPGVEAQSLPSETAHKRQRTRAPETRRSDLMDAAERLFLDKGIAATSIDDIAAGARVAKGTFYLYFVSKEALLAAIQERFVEGFNERLQKAMDRHRPDNWNARLRAWVQSGFDTYLDHVALHDVVFHEFKPEQRHGMHDNVVIHRLAAFLEAGAKAGAWTVDDPRRVAIILFNALHGLADDAAAQGEGVDRRRLVRMATTFFERALAPRS
jgi:AcrR family transcriptional regulator